MTQDRVNLATGFLIVTSKTVSVKSALLKMQKKSEMCNSMLGGAVLYFRHILYLKCSLDKHNLVSIHTLKIFLFISDMYKGLKAI